MALPQPRNVLPLEGQIDLNVSAKVTETINELIKDKPARLVARHRLGDMDQMVLDLPFRHSNQFGKLAGRVECPGDALHDELPDGQLRHAPLL